MRYTSVAITKISYLSPEGSGIEAFYRQINQKNTKFEIENYDPDGYLGKKGLRYVGDATKLYCNLAFKCLDEVNTKVLLNAHPDRFGLYDGSELANLEEAINFDLVAKVEGPDYVSPMKTPNTLANASASLMAIKSGIKGPNFSVCGGAAGSLQALDIACLHIRNRITDVGIVVSTESNSKYHQALHRGEKVTGKVNYAPPFGVGFKLTYPELAEWQKEKVYGRIKKVVSGQNISYETPADTMCRLIEGVFENRFRPQDIDAIIISGVMNFDLGQLISELWWNLEIEHAKVYCPEQDFGICDSSGGSVGILYALGLSTGRIPSKEPGKNKNYIIASLDRLGYGVVTLVRI